jgi:hypothetical protein
MKILSNDVVTSTQLKDIDLKQSKQISNLRLVVGISAALNLFLACWALFRTF